MIQGWDLARTAKADERLDPGLRTMAFTAWKAVPAAVLRRPRMFAAGIKPATGADR